MRARRRWARPVLVGVAVTLAGAAVWAVWFSPLLTLRSVDVRGAAILSAAEIRQTAALPVGVPLARLDLAAARRRLATLPPVAEARASLDWPRAVTITVVERAAVAVMPDGGRFAEIDRTGVRFNTIPAAPPGIPVIDPGARGMSHDTLDAALAVATALPQQALGRVKSISAASPNDVSLALTTGATVRWGDASNPGRKAQVLAVLLRYGARWYDVSAPDAPAYR